MIETVAEQPFEQEMLPGILYDEVRAGYRKWLHLLCPECGVPIQLEAAGQKHSWIVGSDWLCRSTVTPSIWEMQSCEELTASSGSAMSCGVTKLRAQMLHRRQDQSWQMAAFGNDSKRLSDYFGRENASVERC